MRPMPVTMSPKACVVLKPIARPRTVAISMSLPNSSALSATPSNMARFAVSIKSYSLIVPREAVVSASRIDDACAAPPAMLSKLAPIDNEAAPNLAISIAAPAAFTPSATKPATPAPFANAPSPPAAVPAALSNAPKSCLTLLMAGDA